MTDPLKAFRQACDTGAVQATAAAFAGDLEPTIAMPFDKPFDLIPLPPLKRYTVEFFIDGGGEQQYVRKVSIGDAFEDLAAKIQAELNDASYDARKLTIRIERNN